MSGNQHGAQVGRWTLFALAFTHVLLTYGSAREGFGRIALAAAVLGGSFLVLGIRSHRAGVQSFWGGFALLATAIVVGSWTGVSPVGQGWPIKLLFLGGLALAALTAGTVDDDMEGST